MWWPDVVMAVVQPPLWGFGFARCFRLPRSSALRVWAFAAVMGGMVDVSFGQWPGAVTSWASALVAVWLLWRNWSGRKRALAALGNKARARLAAIAAALKDAARGARPVLRPVPGSAS